MEKYPLYMENSVIKHILYPIYRNKHLRNKYINENNNQMKDLSNTTYNFQNKQTLENGN